MFTCGFFNSVRGDRKYNSRQISQMFDGLITDGVIAHYGSHFAVTPLNGMTLNIGDGRCWFDHVWGLNDGNTTLTFDPSDLSQNRVDAIIIEIDSSDEVRNAFLKIKKGALGGAKPDMVNTTALHQHPLAYVTIPASVTSIAKSNIQVVVGTSECPFATSILESVSIDNLLIQFEGEFDEWFANIQAQLSGNVATNLQNQITANTNSINSLQTSKADLSTVNSMNTTLNMLNSKNKITLLLDTTIYVSLHMVRGITWQNKYLFKERVSSDSIIIVMANTNSIILSNLQSETSNKRYSNAKIGFSFNDEGPKFGVIGFTNENGREYFNYNVLAFIGKESDSTVGGVCFEQVDSSYAGPLLCPVRYGSSYSELNSIVAYLSNSNPYQKTFDFAVTIPIKVIAITK